MTTRTIGILGAYGNVGAEVVRELARFPGYRLVLGGRDRSRLERLAASSGAGCVVRVVDVEDGASVAGLCAGCDVVVNASRYTEALAEAVFAAGRHLVDTTAFRGDLWRDREAALKDRGVHWVLYAGWIPGIPECVTAYLEAVATRRFGAVRSVEVYVYDRNEYRGRGLLDLVGGFFYGPGVMNAVEFVRRRGRGAPAPKPALTDEAARMRTMPALRIAALPRPAGRKLVMSVGRDPRRKVFIAYDPSVLVPMLRAFWYGTTRTEDWLAEHVVGPSFRRRVERHGPAEILRGRANGANGQGLEVEFVETRRDGYWLSGVVPATAARMICEGRLDRSGLLTLDQAMDPIALADELSRVGVDYRVKP